MFGPDQGQVLFRLRVKRRIFDLGFDKDPAVIFDLVCFHLRKMPSLEWALKVCTHLQPSFILFVHNFFESFDNLVRHNVDMLATYIEQPINHLRNQGFSNLL